MSIVATINKKPYVLNRANDFAAAVHALQINPQVKFRNTQVRLAFEGRGRNQEVKVFPIGSAMFELQPTEALAKNLFTRFIAVAAATDVLAQTSAQTADNVHRDHSGLQALTWALDQVTTPMTWTRKELENSGSHAKLARAVLSDLM